MFDKDLVKEILKQIHTSALTIESRFEPISKVDDFTESQQGMEKLDAICMQLITIGENLKNLDKVTEGKLLSKHEAIDWKAAMRMRDIISHHYFDIDAEVVFDVCQNKIGLLAKTVKQILEELK